MVAAIMASPTIVGTVHQSVLAASAAAAAAAAVECTLTLGVSTAGPGAEKKHDQALTCRFF